MSLGNQIIYKQLFQQHGLVRVPIIQRDFAQGRPDETEVREEFLNTLKDALEKPENAPELPLNLDFIYGSVEGDGETRFLPLDGQQRLTTLFLLHWYLAWKDDRWEEFSALFQFEQHSRFTYSVRPSSNEFFDELVNYHPNARPDDIRYVAQLVSDQPWYFRSWRLDPTIQSVLGMLEAIHERFSASSGLFSRLIDQDKPAITFQLLDLENFGLSDDLYIKMNARGKPLTPFENFKARYEHELEGQFDGVTFKVGGQTLSVAKYVALRMDSTWTDLFWRLRDTKSNLYDGALMNMFRAVALVTRNPGDDGYLDDFIRLRNAFKLPSYMDFHAHGWLDERFTLTIIHLFDAWSMEDKSLSVLLPDNRYFDENEIFNKVVTNQSLSNAELVQFAAYAGFVEMHQGGLDATAFQEWMRIVHNLSVNTEYNRPDDIRRSIVGLNLLLQHSEDVLKYFAESDTPPSGFNMQQLAEEKLKAELILSHGTWRELIDQAEVHGYFKGQIEFLLDFSGAIASSNNSKPISWQAALHEERQESFIRYLKLAELMFTHSGLRPLSEYLWQRALLSTGDYLLLNRRNYSFLVNSITDQASWKRMLRAAGEAAAEAREILHELWEKLTPNQQSIEAQLKEVIDENTDLEPWRAAFVNTPMAIKYCESQLIRWNTETEIYLLSKTQMNGAHAELFTYCLYHNSLVPLANNDQLRPFTLEPYCEVIGTEFEPGVRLSFRHTKNTAFFEVEFQKGRYKLYVHNSWLEKWPELLAWLSASDFSAIADKGMYISPDNIEVELIKLARYLAKVTEDI